MRGRFIVLLFLGLLFLSFGCGRGQSGEGTKPQLLIQLPKRLSAKPKRLESFLSKVVRWEVYIEKNGERIPIHNGPLDIQQELELSFPSLEAPYILRVKVWDTTDDGFLRSFPVMLGSKKVTQPIFPETWTILLRLQVSVVEFDRIDLGLQ